MPFCVGVEAYNEQSLGIKYHSQGEQTMFYEPTPSAQDPLVDTNSQGLTEDSGNARANIPNATTEGNLRGTYKFSRVVFEHIPGTQGFWRVASSNRFETTERTHRRTSLSHAHYKLNRVETGDYVFKIDLQDAYFHVLITSEQQEVPSFCLRKQGIRHKTQFNKWPIFSHQDKNFRRGQSSLIGFVLANILLNLFYKTDWRYNYEWNFTLNYDWK